jgi:hypothetical protein
MARLIRTILPLITKLGVATENDVEIDGAAVTWGFITAWARHDVRRED